MNAFLYNIIFFLAYKMIAGQGYKMYLSSSTSTLSGSWDESCSRPCLAKTSRDGTRKGGSAMQELSP